MKKIFALSAASILAAAPAVAGPYANVEANSSFKGSDYSSTLIEKHIGYEGELGEDTTWYVQGGPALEFVDGSGTESKVSGKVGASVAVTEDVDAYGEVSIVSAEGWDLGDSDYGIKAGVTYRF